MSLKPEVETEILNLLRGGRKIEAIKLIRKLSGLGLKEAKDLAESLEARGEERPLPHADAAAADKAGSRSDEPSSVTAALRRGDKIEAIREYRAVRKVGLKEAKEAVERMQRGSGGVSGAQARDPAVKVSRGCFSIVIVTLAVLALAPLLLSI